MMWNCPPEWRHLWVWLGCDRLRLCKIVGCSLEDDCAPTLNNCKDACLHGLEDGGEVSPTRKEHSPCMQAASAEVLGGL